MNQNDVVMVLADSIIKESNKLDGRSLHLEERVRTSARMAAFWEVAISLEIHEKVSEVVYNARFPEGDDA